MSTVMPNEEVAANIAANVCRLLVDRNWSQCRLSKETGDSHMTIVNAINGDHTPSSGVLARIAEALGVATDVLVSTPPPPPKKRRRSA